MLGKGTDLSRGFCASTSTSAAPINLIEKVFAVKFFQDGHSNQLEFKLSRGFSNVRPVYLVNRHVWNPKKGLLSLVPTKV